MKMVNVDKDSIKETGNVLAKLTSSERGSFILVMFFALATICAIVWFYVNNVADLVDKYNQTISKQQTEFLQALKEFK